MRALLLALLLLPAVVRAEERLSTTRFICLTEQAVLEIADADAKSLKDHQKKLLELTLSRRCFVLRSPVYVVLVEKIHTYTDHTGEAWTVYKFQSTSTDAIGFWVFKRLAEKGSI